MSDETNIPAPSATSGYFDAERLELIWRYTYRPEFVPLHVEYLGVNSGDNILGVGCGTGFLSRLLARSVPNATLTGIDTDRTALEIGREMIAFEQLDGRVNLQPGSAFELPFPDGHFEAVTSQTLM